MPYFPQQPGNADRNQNYQDDQDEHPSGEGIREHHPLHADKSR
jgi:hypothetical protein